MGEFPPPPESRVERVIRGCLVVVVVIACAYASCLNVGCLAGKGIDQAGINNERNPISIIGNTLTGEAISSVGMVVVCVALTIITYMGVVKPVTRKAKGSAMITWIAAELAKRGWIQRRSGADRRRVESTNDQHAGGSNNGHNH